MYFLNFKVFIFLASVNFINCVTIDEVTDKGEWSLKHELSIPFTIKDKQYFYGSYGKHWFIRELLEDGIMGPETETGVWEHFYFKAISYSLDDDHDGRGFLYLISDKNSWVIHELLPSGKIGEKTDSGLLDSMPSVIFPYKIYGEHFLFYQIDHHWSIHKLKSGGKIGLKTDGGTWNSIYRIGFAYSHYVYFFTVDYNYYFIQELLPNGRLGQETIAENWKDKHEISFPFSMNAYIYLYALSDKNKWSIRELTSDGKAGSEESAGAWPEYHSVSFPFRVKGKQFLYGLHDYYWKIWKIVEY